MRPARAAECTRWPQDGSKCPRVRPSLHLSKLLCVFAAYLQIQDAQRLAEAGKAEAEGHTKAARWGIEFEVQRQKRQDNHIDLLKDKQKQQGAHIEMLKDQLEVVRH